MLEKFANIFRIPELRKRIFFTLWILIVYRLGGHIPTPGINPVGLAEYFHHLQGTLFGMMDMFVGGALSKATIFALGIMPYISSSIIIQLLGAVYEPIKQLQREGQEGRQKIIQYTRYGTVLIAVIQAFGIAVYLEGITRSTGQTIVIFPGLGFKLLTVLTLTTGTIFIMWLGEQITTRGIGNGISLIIFIGIVARLPESVIQEIKMFSGGQRTLGSEIIIFVIVVSMIAFIVFVSQGTRRVPIQTPKRIVGRKIMQGQSSFLPLKVNAAGVIPVIFASSIMFAPSTVATFFPNVEIVQYLAHLFSPGAALYTIFYGLMIVFFTYFYTAIQFNPQDIADNLKKSGGFIPGIRPGKHTSQFIDNILTRITLPGAFFLAFISLVPFMLIAKLNVTFFLGGTSVLIVVGVALDTLQQIESHLMMRHYSGFMKSGRMKGRRNF